MIKDWLRSFEMQVLLAHVTGRNRAWLFAHPEASLTPEQEQAFQQARQRFEQGEPLPYILGHWEFYGLDFIVTPEVLIPRPETELLIDLARTQLGPGSRLIDIGTGSGCIPVTLATVLPNAEIVATDISPAALTIARLNAEKHGVGGRIRFCEADLFPLDLQSASFDLILSNPPYIPTETLHGLEVFGREPTLALDGGPDGMDTIRRLLVESKRWLAPGGALLVEIESGLGQLALETAARQFPGAKIQVLKDLAGLDRVLSIVT
ncbi:MAG: peptide chain release factor N(5)-glutamine methyltransferase [Chloroflexi bacterium HGW-Chloroflexi-6]|nr:MAG: peptide chain release factor N(5)-glutamine methyltransferase [Chloroflexi bacterium HGW-Chloroflexi-6]